MSEPRDAAARDATRDATAGRVYAPLVPSSASNSSIRASDYYSRDREGQLAADGLSSAGGRLCMCATRDRVELQELTHGRLAMVAFAGMIHQVFVTGKPVLASLGDIFA